MKLEELLSKHLWGCKIGWGSKEEQADQKYQEQWCDCGILEIRKEYKKLKEKLEQFEKGYFTCPDCGYGVTPSEFLTGGDITEDLIANSLEDE